jgi:cellulose biosynthesis protein BcsQ
VISLNNVHKIIAVYGNSGSYKTSTAVNLAKAISKETGSNTKIAVVSLDHTKPLIPLLFPETKADTSLGRLLSCECLDQNAILAEMNMQDNIGFLGYNSGENIRCYTYPTADRIDEFFTQMRHLVNYTIIDCGTDVFTTFTSKALVAADEVLYMLTCDVNGLEFFHSQESILLSEHYGYNNYLRFLTITGRFVHDEEAMKNAVRDVETIIPFCEGIPRAWNEGKALSPVTDAEYNDAVKGIAEYLTRKEADK